MTTLYDKVNKLYDEILEIEYNTRSSLANSGYVVNERLTQEQIDYYSIYEDLKSILAPMLDEYKILFRTNIAHKAKKVFFVAICEMVKQDFTRGMLITFRYVTHQEINTARYYDILTIVSRDQGLKIPIVNDRRLFEEAYILETGIPRNLSKYVIKIFNIYWRYFRTFEKAERLKIIHDFLNGTDFSNVYILNPLDYTSLETYRAYLKQFPEKAIRVFDRLDDIFQALDEYSSISTDHANKYAFADIISKQVGYDITCVLRDSEMESIYYSYLNKIPIRKFKSILNNLLKDEQVVFPSGEKRRVVNISENMLCYGIYKIRNIQYEVIADPTIPLEEMAHSRCDTIIQLAADYYMYVSEYEFDIELDGKIIYPRQLFYKGIARFVWLGKLGPASTAIVDGNTIISEQKSKISGKVIKCFDYEKKQSRLQYYLSCVKMIYPEKRYGRLEYSIDNESSRLIAAGSPQGLYYRENIRIELEPWISNHILRFTINGEIVEERNIFIEDIYLFDKWQGTLYSENSINDNHSGAFVLFSKHPIDDGSFDYLISNHYEWGDFSVYEFSIDTRTDSLHINNHLYEFGKAGKPYFFFVSETGDNELVEKVGEMVFKVFNIGEQNGFWFGIENEKENIKVDIKDGTYFLKDVLAEQQLLTCGKWICSLWDHQKKLSESSFTVIPEFKIEQIDPCVLEGKNVQIKITANDECFMSSDGEFSNYSVIDSGRAAFTIEEGSVVPQAVETYIFFDKLNVVKNLTYIPQIWGVRSKNGKAEWSNDEIVNIRPDNTEDTKIAIFSTGNNILYINGRKIVVKPGTTMIPWHRIIGEIRGKNDLILTDQRSTLKKVIGCSAKFSFVSAEVKDDVIITIGYYGPMSEWINVRCFIDGELRHTFNRDALKNIFDIHVIVGKTDALYGRRITVDVGTSRAAIPITVYDSICNKPIAENVIQHKQPVEKARLPKEIPLQISFKELEAYTDAKVLSEWFYQSSADTNLVIDIHQLQEYYWRKG